METHSKAGAGIGRHPLFRKGLKPRKELKRRVSTCFSSLCCVFCASDGRHCDFRGDIGSSDGRLKSVIGPYAGGERDRCFWASSQCSTTKKNMQKRGFPCSRGLEFPDVSGSGVSGNLGFQCSEALGIRDPGVPRFLIFECSSLVESASVVYRECITCQR